MMEGNMMIGHGATREWLLMVLRGNNTRRERVVATMGRAKAK